MLADEKVSNRNKPEVAISLRKIMMMVKKIPCLKIYRNKVEGGKTLQTEINFALNFRRFFKQKAKETESFCIDHNEEEQINRALLQIDTEENKKYSSS